MHATVPKLKTFLQKAKKKKGKFREGFVQQKQLVSKEIKAYLYENIVNYDSSSTTFFNFPRIFERKKF